MAQTGFTPILLYASNTTTSVPSAGNLTNSANGAEVAVNTADKRLFTKDSGGAVVELGTNPSTFSLPNGTANGVLYLNGSKVATSGSALTFDGTNLGVGGAASQRLHVQNAGALIGLLQNTASTADARYRIQNTGGSSDWGVDGTGTYFQDNNSRPFLWFTGGSEQMRLTSTGLGIGTSSPASAYSGAARVAMVSATSTNAASLRVSSANASGELYSAGATTEWGLYSASNSPFSIWTNNNKNLTLDAAGNLGLGVTPSAVSVSDKVVQVGAFLFNNNTNGYGILRYNNFFNGTNDVYYANGSASAFQMQGNAFKWYQAASGTAGNTISFTQAMTLDANGRWVVGSSSPSSLRATIEDNGNQLRIRNTATRYRSDYAVISDGSAEINVFDDVGSVYMPMRLAANTVVFQTGSGSVTERARITSGGYFLFSGLTTSAGNYWIQAKNTNSSSNCAYLENASGNDRGILLLKHDQAAGATTGAMVVFQNSAGTTVGTITSSNTATAYNTSSDYRLKDNPQPLTNSGAFIDALQPKTWEWKADGSRGVGFIAHEAQAVSPTSVVGEKDAVDADGKPVMQAMEYGSAEFIANIIAELQSLRARVAALEAQP